MLQTCNRNSSKLYKISNELQPILYLASPLQFVQDSYIILPVQYSLKYLDSKVKCLISINLYIYVMRNLWLLEPT